MFCVEIRNLLKIFSAICIKVFMRQFTALKKCVSELILWQIPYLHVY